MQANVAFRRAQYVLYDLRYLLAVPPDVWTERLRKGFLYGVGSLLTLLTWMQGMDSVVRQVGPPLPSLVSFRGTRRVWPRSTHVYTERGYFVLGKRQHWLGYGRFLKRNLGSKFRGGGGVKGYNRLGGASYHLKQRAGYASEGV